MDGSPVFNSREIGEVIEERPAGRSLSWHGTPVNTFDRTFRCKQCGAEVTVKGLYIPKLPNYQPKPRAA